MMDCNNCQRIDKERESFDRMEQRKNDEIAELEKYNKELALLVLKAFDLGYNVKLDELYAEMKGREISPSAYRDKLEQLKARVNLLCV